MKGYRSILAVVLVLVAKFANAANVRQESMPWVEETSKKAKAYRKNPIAFVHYILQQRMKHVVDPEWEYLPEEAERQCTARDVDVFV